MRLGDAPLRLAHAVALLLAAAGATHLATVLVLPARGPDSLWERARRAKDGAVGATLAGAALVDLGPDQDPALATALCRYDLRDGPLEVSLDVGAAEYAVLTVLSRHSRVLGSLTSRAAKENRLALAVVPAGSPTPAATATVRAVRVDAPEPEGLVAAQVLFSTASHKPGAEAAARSLSCRPDKRG